jgi:S1-C subfamily serine protease
MFCPSCGTQVPDESSFCLKCGQSMSVAPKDAAAKSRGVASTSSRSWPVQKLLFGLAALVVLGGGLFLYLNRKLPTGALAPTGGAAGAKPSSTPPAPVKVSPGEIAAKFSDAVVVLESYNDQGQKLAQGSGFIFSPDGKVFTNYHVIRGAARMQVRMHDQSTHDAEYVAGVDMQHDIAALQIEGNGLPSVHLGNSSTVKTGDHVTALGAPLGLESTLTDGIISAVREAGSFRVFQTSAPVSHGSSGGPLFDDYGDVVALAVSTVEAGENLNFAVPIDSAKALLKSEHQTTFAELLASTTVHQPILTSSLSVPPQNGPILLLKTSLYRPP